MENLSCLACQSSFSFKRYHEHLSQEVHVEKSKLMNYYFCRICELACSGDACFKQHIAGKAHLKNLEKFIAIDNMQKITAQKVTDLEITDEGKKAIVGDSVKYPISSSMDVLDTMMKQNSWLKEQLPGVTDKLELEDITPNKAYILGGTKICLVSKYPLNHDVVPLFIMWNPIKKEIVELASTNKLCQPTDFEIYQNTVIMIAPEQNMDFLRNEIYEKGNDLNLTLWRKHDGKLAKTSFKFSYLVTMQDLMVTPTACVSTSLVKIFDKFGAMPIVRKKNQNEAFTWMQNHMTMAGYNLRSTALIDCSGVFEQPTVWTQNPIQEMTMIDIVRRWSFNFERKDGKSVQLDDPKLQKMCREISSWAIITNLISLVIWNPKDHDQLFNIGQLNLKSKV